MIPYILLENHLTSDPRDYMARVVSSGTVRLETLVDDIMKRGTTVTRPDILAVLDAYHDVIIDRLLEGQRVSTPTANYGISIEGVFDGVSDEFDPSRHVVDGTLSSGALLRNRIRTRSQLDKHETRIPEPNPAEYMDFASETKDSIVTPGGPGQLNGHRLKFDADDPQQGVFFIASDDNEAQATMIMQNKPANLMFMVPDTLVAGDYTLEVRAAMSEAGALRSGALRHTLTVT